MVEVISSMDWSLWWKHKISDDRYVDARLRRILTEGGGSKLRFGDESHKNDIWLDSSSSFEHMRCFLLECLA
jgi:hypothetical protein